MSEYFGVKVEDIFDTMKERFRPEGAVGVNTSFGYDIKDIGMWKLEISGGEMSLEKKDALSGCDVIMHADANTFVGVNIGKIDGMEMITAGKTKIDGDMMTFGITAKLFRRFTPPGEQVEPEQELIRLNRTISVKQKFATGPVMGKFLKGLKEKKILAIKCPECGRLQSPPREVCAICRVRNEEWVEIGPGGEMRMMEYCFYASPDPLTGESRETPYGAIGILLEGCKDEEVFWHLLNPEQLDKVEMGSVLGSKVKNGTRLRPVWAENRTGSVGDIKYFEIDE
ncbi:MAG: SCP2 sterol-binding domain-containing protein [Deltaproteobacteria bacterium]|nr:SCP2 sterol-binding domain-containing protein [Deltaproteobacteria bacterium]